MGKIVLQVKFKGYKTYSVDVPSQLNEARYDVFLESRAGYVQRGQPTTVLCVDISAVAGQEGYCRQHPVANSQVESSLTAAVAQL